MKLEGHSCLGEQGPAVVVRVKSPDLPAPDQDTLHSPQCSAFCSGPETPPLGRPPSSGNQQLEDLESPKKQRVGWDLKGPQGPLPGCGPASGSEQGSRVERAPEVEGSPGWAPASAQSWLTFGLATIPKPRGLTEEWEEEGAGRTSPAFQNQLSPSWSTQGLS